MFISLTFAIDCSLDSTVIQIKVLGRREEISYSPVLAQIVLSLETLPANFAAEGELRTLMGPFVYHQVVGLGEPTLAVLADELAFWAQFASEIPCVVLVNLHHGEHFVWTKM